MYLKSHISYNLHTQKKGNVYSILVLIRPVHKKRISRNTLYKMEKKSFFFLMYITVVCDVIIDNIKITFCTYNFHRSVLTRTIIVIHKERKKVFSQPFV